MCCHPNLKKKRRLPSAWVYKYPEGEAETRISQNFHMPSNRGVVGWWWRSFFSSRSKSLTSLFRLCPILLLRKSSTLCCVFFGVVRTCGFDLRFSSSRMLSTMLQAKSVSTKHNSRKRYVVFYHISTWVVAWKAKSSFIVPISLVVCGMITSSFVADDRFINFP